MVSPCYPRSQHIWRCGTVSTSEVQYQNRISPEVLIHMYVYPLHLGKYARGKPLALGRPSPFGLTSHRSLLTPSLPWTLNFLRPEPVSLCKATLSA